MTCVSATLHQNVEMNTTQLDCQARPVILHGLFRETVFSCVGDSGHIILAGQHPNVSIMTAGICLTELRLPAFVQRARSSLMLTCMALFNTKTLRNALEDKDLTLLLCPFK